MRMNTVCRECLHLLCGLINASICLTFLLLSCIHVRLTKHVLYMYILYMGTASPGPYSCARHSVQREIFTGANFSKNREMALEYNFAIYFACAHTHCHAPLLGLRVRTYVLHILHSCRANGGRQGSTGSWKGVHWSKITIEHHTYVHFFVDTATHVRVISSPDLNSLGIRGNTKILIFAYGSLHVKIANICTMQNFPLYSTWLRAISHPPSVVLPDLPSVFSRHNDLIAPMGGQGGVTVNWLSHLLAAMSVAMHTATSSNLCSFRLATHATFVLDGVVDVCEEFSGKVFLVIGASLVPDELLQRHTVTDLPGEVEGRGRGVAGRIIQHSRGYQIFT